MATTADLKRLLELIALELERELPGISMRIAMDAKALAERRIKEQGFGEKYSTNRVPAFFMHDKTLNQKGTSFLNRKKTKKDGTNWGELRAAQGLNAKFVDLSYSNEMWRAMSVISTDRIGDNFVSTLGSNNKSAAQKLEWNFLRYGDFMNEALNSMNSLDILQRASNAHIENVIKKLLG